MYVKKTLADDSLRSSESCHQNRLGDITKDLLRQE